MYRCYKLSTNNLKGLQYIHTNTHNRDNKNALYTISRTYHCITNYIFLAMANDMESLKKKKRSSVIIYYICFQDIFRNDLHVVYRNEERKLREYANDVV